MANHQFATTILKAFDVLDCFETGEEELGISEIAGLVGLPASSVHRLIQSLEFKGLLFQNRGTKKYYLGTKFFSFAEKSGRFRLFQKIAVKYVDELAALTRETVNLATSGGDKITNVYKKDSPFILRPNFTLHTTYPAHCTGTGRVFLSEMSDASIRWVYDSCAQEIAAPFADFLDMIHQVQINGYALDDQAFSPGLRCVAAPVRAIEGKTVFALSVSAPLSRMPDELYARTRDLVVQYAGRITEDLQAY